MNESLTVLIERNATFDADFVTEPYEVAWASEARWFVLPIAAEQASVGLTTEISPDGLNWCPIDDAVHEVTTGLVSWAERDFGGWLRLRGSVAGAPMRGSIYLALKA